MSCPKQLKIPKQKLQVGHFNYFGSFSVKNGVGYYFCEIPSDALFISVHAFEISAAVDEPFLRNYHQSDLDRSKLLPRLKLYLVYYLHINYALKDYFSASGQVIEETDWCAVSVHGVLILLPSLSAVPNERQELIRLLRHDKSGKFVPI
ncbi:hypothetical protein WN51_02769 [Melipona quadrifasciata]|uniref:Uncharacterized protein n=1 Tax=Melipona quadrifasciata TaxID=166423 RepID=A0A0M9AAV5_9HYME|nr:hypothetical protein WN51_02769 [Melipona quadrifasciata]